MMNVMDIEDIVDAVDIVMIRWPSNQYPPLERMEWWLSHHYFPLEEWRCGHPIALIQTKT